MSDHRLMALDLGTKCGYGYAPPLRSGAWVLKKRKQHIGHAVAFLKAKLDKFNPTIVGYEVIHFSTTTYSAQFYGGLKAAVLEWTATHDVPCYGFTPQQIKRRATGNGRANKTSVRLHAEQATGRQMTEDQADAFWCLVLLAEKVEGRRTNL